MDAELLVFFVALTIGLALAQIWTLRQLGMLVEQLSELVAAAEEPDSVTGCEVNE